MAVRNAMEHPIGALPRTPFPASRDFPSRGNEGSEEKNSESYTSCTIPVFPPLVPYGTTFPPRWEACYLILSRLRLPANQVPLPPQSGGAAKGKRLNGQARRLTSPHLEVLCRTSKWGTITRAYCRARKCTPFGGWRHHLPPRRGDFILRYALALFFPRLRGKSGAARIGGVSAEGR